MISMQKSVVEKDKCKVSGIIDRIEENYAVVELSGGEFLNIPLGLMPDEVGEGDALQITIERALKETAKLATDARGLLNDILDTSKRSAKK